MVGHVTKGGSIAETHQKLEEMVLREGHRFMSERNEVIELLNVHSLIRYPYLQGEHPYWKGQKLTDYIDQFFKLNNQGFVYTYGDRILEYYNDGLNVINQLEYVIDKLLHNPNSRRAVMTIYDPIRDNGVEDVPCLQHIQYQVRSGVLLTTIQYRSHDVDAYYPNLCGLAEVSKYIASQLGLYIGEIHVMSNNLHKYVTEV